MKDTMLRLRPKNHGRGVWRAAIRFHAPRGFSYEEEGCVNGRTLASFSPRCIKAELLARPNILCFHYGQIDHLFVGRGLE